MTRFFAALAAIMFSLVATASAHRQPEVETTIEVITGTVSPFLGITHRLHAHDAMTLLRVLGEAAPDLADERQLARLSAYAVDRLDLTGEAASQAVGAEIEGNYVFIYVRHPEVAGVEGAAFLDGVLPGWANTVHAKGADGSTLHSVTFSADRRRLADGTAPIVPGGLAVPGAGTDHRIGVSD